MSHEIRDLINTLTAIRRDLIALDSDSAQYIAEASPTFVASARNLVHYVALRRCDLRDLQVQLARLGLSSLGRAEGHVLANLDAVVGHLRRMSEVGQNSSNAVPSVPAGAVGPNYDEGEAALESHTLELLGPEPAGRRVRIMVTVPGAAANSPALIRDLVAAGMDCMRINCAHDSPTVWAKMIAKLREAENELSRPCRVLMDLGGPKLRTGPFLPGPRIVKVQPRRDEFGRVVEPARVWLTTDPSASPAGHTALPVDKEWLAGLAARDRVRFTDARDADRELQICAVESHGASATISRTAYIQTGTRLRIRQNRRQPRKRRDRTTQVDQLPERPGGARLQIGDTLQITRDAAPGTCAANGQPARLSCTLPEVLADVRAGESVWFDDGRIGGVVQQASAELLIVAITYTAPGGAWLRADKGINLPDTDLRLPALTAVDLEDLRFVTAHADMAGYSFVHSAEDVAALYGQFAALNRKDLAVMLKIETRRAFNRLPEILLAAMRGPTVGVMIARGDLAVECGFERLAEIQEEILWMCEAAHVPVVWATQVLENLAKEGRPSRAEITDAAMGERAECVMLNTGPHVVEAVQLLDSILRRMEKHQFKKRSRLRPLHVARLFFETIAATNGAST